MHHIRREVGDLLLQRPLEVAVEGGSHLQRQTQVPRAEIAAQDAQPIRPQRPLGPADRADRAHPHVVEGELRPLSEDEHAHFHHAGELLGQVEDAQVVAPIERVRKTPAKKQNLADHNPIVRGLT